MDTSQMKGREQYIAGMRELADMLEKHETIPLPIDGRLVPIDLCFLGHNETPQQWAGQRAERARVAALLPGKFTERTQGVYSRLVGRLGGPDGLRVELSAFATGPARFCSACGTERPGHTGPGAGQVATLAPEHMPEGAL